MVMGPLEYVVIGFEGHHFTGEILPKVREIQSKGIIRLIDLVFVKRTAGGSLEIQEISDLGVEEAREYEELSANIRGLLTKEDIELATRDFPEQSAAAIALFEHIWAKDLKEAILQAK